MDRKKKLRIVQLCLISIGILTLIFTYSDKINLKKKSSTAQELKKEIDENMD